MTKQIDVEHFANVYFMALEETFEKVHGIYLDGGTSLFETLDTVTAQEASLPVSATCASIAAQVAHVSLYLNVLADYMQEKDVGEVDWGEIWRTVQTVSPEEWDTLKLRLRESYQNVHSLMEGFEGWDGAQEIDGALGILVHTAYHLGEIRQALCTVKNR